MLACKVLMDYVHHTGLLHFMTNRNCTSPLKMLTTFNNADAGELTMLDKIFGFDAQAVQAATGLNLVSCWLLLHPCSLTLCSCPYQNPVMMIWTPIRTPRHGALLTP